MFRKEFKKRENYAERLDEIGFQYHNISSTDDGEYWTEGVAYEFTLKEIEEIESATENLHEICMETVGEIIESGDYAEGFRLNDESISLIEHSWNNDDAHIYGRFDLLFEPTSSAIKMFEYNADTPTALLESAVAQWHWLEEAENVPHRDQFNSIHEKLIARWSEIKPPNENPTLYVFASKDGHYEDWGNLEYMAETAMQGGWEIHVEEIENLGYNAHRVEFTDTSEAAVKYAFKLYPWEWMMREPFGEFVIDCRTIWFEPPWKMLLSNKAILPVLWQKYPNHPNLLPAFFENDKPAIDFRHRFVKKPILGREGANVQFAGTFTDSLISGSHHAPQYDADGYIYQEFATLPNFQGWHPVIGSWVIGDAASGIGIREDRTIVSGNGSHFVPHYFVN